MTQMTQMAGWLLASTPRSRGQQLGSVARGSRLCAGPDLVTDGIWLSRPTRTDQLLGRHSPSPERPLDLQPDFDRIVKWLRR